MSALIITDDSGVPQNPSSLLSLALHILSICPNSASCEHLFSQFGLILTKIWSHLKKKTLVDLAQYKMHIRDEHLRKKNKLFLRQCAFGVNAESASNQVPSCPISTPSSTMDVVMAGPLDNQLPTGSVAAETDSRSRSTQSITHLTSHSSSQTQRGHWFTCFSY